MTQVGLTESGEVIEEEAPQVWNQYAIYEDTDDYGVEQATTVVEQAPSTTYNNFSNLKKNNTCTWM